MKLRAVLREILHGGPLHEWREAPAPWKPVQLIDGTMGGNPLLLMRRYVNGQWQYRRATADEYEDHLEHKV